MSDETTIVVTPPAESERPLWLTELLERTDATNQLMREVLLEIRNASQASSTLVPSLLETNQQLTRQLQETPQTILTMLTPLLSPPQPPIVLETAELESENEGDLEEAETLEAEEVTQEVPNAERRRKLRFL